jgi:hypothetical protein
MSGSQARRLFRPDFAVLWTAYWADWLSGLTGLAGQRFASKTAFREFSLPARPFAAQSICQAIQFAEESDVRLNCG